jgi:NADPH:quinone reductase-like Zn-dependent oxidoreductase
MPAPGRHFHPVLTSIRRSPSTGHLPRLSDQIQDVFVTRLDPSSTAHRPRTKITSLLTTLEPLVLNQTFDSPIETSYSLEKIHAAIEHHESPHRAGKILLSIS